MKRAIRNILLYSFVCLVGCTVSQYSIYNVKVDKIQEVQGKSKNQIYNRSLKWIALNTGWSKSVIDYKDSTIATIVVKSNVPTYDFTEIVHVPCIFEINIKDEKVNIIVTNNDMIHTFDKDGKRLFKENLEDICQDYFNYLNKNDDF